MVQWMDRATEGFTHMGGEGANWIGEAPFSKRAHVFQNLGDGTYDHSGTLAIRFAVASGVNITYKILFNDAVAMTGGQHLEGNLTVDMIARQVAAENVKRVRRRLRRASQICLLHAMAKGLTIKDRHALDRVQRELAAIPGVTVLIYDQTCAAEKRRRRKKKRCRIGQARLHQRTRLRRLRRLRGEVQLRFACSRSKPNSAASG
jgi:indolepyruvate ferredoxin oxidoreductase